MFGSLFASPNRIDPMAKKSASKSAPAPRKRAKKKRAAATVQTKAHTPKEEQEYIQTEFIKRHDIPDVAINAAQDYANAMKAKSKATEKFNTKKDNLMAIMREEGVDRVPVEIGGVTKLVHIESQDKVTLEVPGKDGDQ